MKIFLDSANVEEIKEAVSWGIIDGLTTNPTLLAKEGKDPRKLLKDICAIVPGPVNAEVISLDAKGIVAEADELVKIASNIVIKIPVNQEGLKAVSLLAKKKIKTTVTLIFSSTQALLAAKAGATYVCPFIGRLDDISQDGMSMVDEIKVMFDNYNISTQILVASVRHPIHVVQSALIGADAVTVPFKVIKQLLKHPLTDAGIEKFLDDWKKLEKSKK
ncbi:MAG: fructose-6-phosphate aldolase [bacterium]